jgi:hypothetical protein
MIPVMSHDLRFKHTFSCIISDPSGSGNSSFYINFLQNLDTLCTEPNFDGGILWCYGEKNTIPSQLASVDALGKGGGKVRFYEGLPENFLDEESNPCLINLDVLLIEVNFIEVFHLFTKGAITAVSANSNNTKSTSPGTIFGPLENFRDK